MELRVSAEFQQLEAALARAPRQVRFATAMALTRTVKAAQEAQERALPSVFDRPTPFTKRAIGIVPATRSMLAASVYVRPAQARYLALQETGGRRVPPKGKRALVVPVGARLNAYGNLPRKALQAIKARKGVFVGQVDGVGGIWRRPVRRRGRPDLLVAFEPTATYRARFGFRKRALATIRAAIGPAFRASIAAALRSAR